MSRRLRVNLKTADLQELVTEYIRLATAYGEALLHGTSKETNKLHGDLTQLHRALRERGPEAQRELLGLLEHKDTGVRCWAAVHTLEFAPEQGAPVLRALSSGLPSPWRLTAELLLEEWQQGRLPPPK